MHWFDTSPKATALYGLTALLAIVEVGVLLQALRTNVTDDYRAYYITRTTTCLPQPVTAAYSLGTLIDFTNNGDIDAGRELLPCGWEHPNGDGRQSLGESSRMRFLIGTPQDLQFTITMKGINLNNEGDRDVWLFAGTYPIGRATVGAESTDTFTFKVPGSAIEDGYLDLRFDFPNALKTSLGTSSVFWRSVKLISAQLSLA